MDNFKPQGRHCLKMICKSHEGQCLFLWDNVAL